MPKSSKQLAALSFLIGFTGLTIYHQDWKGLAMIFISVTCVYFLKGSSNA